MADRKVLTHLDFLKASEIQNVLVHKLAAAPGSPVEGQLYYDTVTHKLYVHNGTSFVACQEAITGGEGLTRTADDLKVNVDNVFLKIVADVLTPQTEGTGTKLATTGYVDTVAQGLDVKNSCKLATNAVLSPASVQSGKELVGETTGAIANIDGKAPSVNDRILVKDEAAGSKRGIYKVLSVGGGAEKYKLIRDTDADETGELSGGTFTFIEEGTANGDSGWVISEPTGAVTIGVTSMTWTQFTALGQIIASGGIGKVGNSLFVEAGSGLTQETDGLKVDTSVIATRTFAEEKGGGKFSANVGNGSLTSIPVTHSLGTRDVQVEVYRNSTPWDTVDCTVVRETTNIVTLQFNVAPTTEQFRVVIRS